MTFTVPIKLTGSLNSREHWSARARRVKAERRAVAAFAPLPYVWRQLAAEAECFRITLTRVAPRKLDDDNWVGRAKGVRDEVARLLRIDDGSTQLEWKYTQEKPAAGAGESVRVLVEPLPLDAPFTRSTAHSTRPGGKTHV